MQTPQQAGMGNGVLLRPGLQPCHLVLVLIQDVAVKNKQAASPGLYGEAGEQRKKESSTQLCSARVAHHLRHDVGGSDKRKPQTLT